MIRSTNRDDRGRALAFVLLLVCLAVSLAPPRQAEPRVMIEADLLPAQDWQWWPAAYLDDLEHDRLTVETPVSTHSGVIDHHGALDFLVPGRKAAREHCLAQARLGVHRLGCPPFFTRGDWIAGMDGTFDGPFEAATKLRRER